MTNTKIGELKQLYAAVTAELSAYQDNSAWDPVKDYSGSVSRRRSAEKTMMDALAQRGAKFGQDGGTYKVSVGGIRSSSTSSYAGALRNWRKSASAKIMEARRNLQ